MPTTPTEPTTAFKQQVKDALVTMFHNQDRAPFVALLDDDFVLKVPRSLPYGGEKRGAEGFDRFYESIIAGDRYEYFRTETDGVLDAGDHLVVPLRIVAEGKNSDHTMTVENLWLVKLEGDRVAWAQIYADTAAGLATSA
jgi:hypothetical protein